MTLSGIVASVLNNIIILAVGGLAALYFAWRLWNKVESIRQQTSTWGKLIFWVAQMFIIVLVIFRVGAMIYTTSRDAVAGFVNGPSIQAGGQAIVDLAAQADSLLGLDGSSFAGNVSAGASTVNLVTPPLRPTATPVLVNSGAAASFEQAPVNLNDNSEAKVITAMDAVIAVESLANPTQEPMTYINTFLADNLPTIEVSTANGAYTVKRGDSLAKIAKAIYGTSDGWRQICEANRNVIRDCNNISSGMTLVIPGQSGSAIVAQPVTKPVANANPVVVAPAIAQPVVVAPVIVAQPARTYDGQVVVNTAADAINAIQAIAPTATPAPVVAVVVPTNTPRAVNTYAELKAQQAQAQSGESAAEYIANFLAEQKSEAVAGQ